MPWVKDAHGKWVKREAPAAMAAPATHDGTPTHFACSACAVRKARDMFSPSQLKKATAVRRCKLCVEAGTQPQSGTGVARVQAAACVDLLGSLRCESCQSHTYIRHYRDGRKARLRGGGCQRLVQKYRTQNYGEITAVADGPPQADEQASNEYDDIRWTLRVCTCPCHRRAPPGGTRWSPAEHIWVRTVSYDTEAD